MQNVLNQMLKTNMIQYFVTAFRISVVCLQTEMVILVPNYIFACLQKLFVHVDRA